MGYIIVGTIIGGIIWGIVVNKVIENKGYKEDWFWWGFFFGIFALIIALTKQSVNTTRVVIESSAPVKENMELLSSCILNKQVNVSSPIHITAWEIKKDAEKLVLFIDFVNVSQKAISAVMFSATGFNSFGDIVQVNDADLFDVMGQDLSIKPNECGRVYAALQDDAIRKVELKVKKVCFADGSIADDISDEWINTNQFELNSIHIDCARRVNAQSKYYAIIKECCWQCVCGFVNTQNTCAICGMQKSNAVKFTLDNIEDTYSEYLKQLENEKFEEEKRKLEEKRLQEEKEKLAELRLKKAKKILFITIPIVILAIVFIALANYVLIPNYKYDKATELLKTMNYDDAYKLFYELDDYKDSKEQLKEIKPKLSYKAMLKYAEIKDVITFGRYEQDGDTTNQTEPIEWKVIDKIDNKVFLSSKYCLDIHKYSNGSTKYWENSAVREWLNADFLNMAFNQEEQKYIIETEVNNDYLFDEFVYESYGGPSTKDKIFILSIDETDKYGEDACLPTKYAESKEPKFFVKCYWLRSPVSQAVTATSGGEKGKGGYASNVEYIKPVMWVSID